MDAFDAIKLVNWARFEKKIKKEDGGCWIYVGYRNEKGYGATMVRREGKGHLVKAHRLMYSKYIGRIPDGMVVCHTCDNPSCVNPEHLFVGTQADNLKDMHAKGRRKYPEKIKRRTIEERRNDDRERRRVTYDMWAGGLSQKEVAVRLGICKRQVSERLRRYRADNNIR